MGIVLQVVPAGTGPLAVLVGLAPVVVGWILAVDGDDVLAVVPLAVGTLNPPLPQS